MEEARSGVASLPRLRPERPRPLLGPRGHHDSEGWRSCFLGSSRGTAMFHWRSNPESRGHGSAAAPLSRDSLPRFPSWKPPRSLALHGEQGRDGTGRDLGWDLGWDGPALGPLSPFVPALSKHSLRRWHLPGTRLSPSHPSPPLPAIPAPCPLRGGEPGYPAAPGLISPAGGSAGVRHTNFPRPPARGHLCLFSRRGHPPPPCCHNIPMATAAISSMPELQ